MSVDDKARQVSDWWSRNPQSYAEVHGTRSFKGVQENFGDTEFFRKADAQFLSWNSPYHDKVPFDRLFPYGRFRGKRVLEIGCGMGFMASQWATQGAHLSAVDLAPFSIEMTRRRFELMGLSGDIRQADGRTLPFEDHTFDYVYSFGVLHHSPDLVRSLTEMMRVLKSGGEYGLMLYHRNSFYYRWRILFHEGYVHNERDFLDPIALASRYTDASEAEGNPHTWPVTQSEVRAMLAPYCSRVDFDVMGGEADIMLNMMLPGFGRLIPKWALKPWQRRWGWSLWSHGTRA